MASVRETIEWTYKDDKGLWKYCDYKHVLHLRGQPVAKIMFICLLLLYVYYMYVTMNGSQISEYLVMMPPSFEEWVSQGPQVRPLPNTSIFSGGFVYDDDDDTSDDDNDDANDN